MSPGVPGSACCLCNGATTGHCANARFLADLGDPDASFAVLLGGQDGWLGSSTFADQLEPWQNGGYCQLPLRPETIRASFPHVSVFDPREPGEGAHV